MLNEPSRWRVDGEGQGSVASRSIPGLALFLARVFENAVKSREYRPVPFAPGGVFRSVHVDQVVRVAVDTRFESSVWFTGPVSDGQVSAALGRHLTPTEEHAATW